MRSVTWACRPAIAESNSSPPGESLRENRLPPPGRRKGQSAQIEREGKSLLDDARMAPGEHLCAW